MNHRDRQAGHPDHLTVEISDAYRVNGLNLYWMCSQRHYTVTKSKTDCRGSLPISFKGSHSLHLVSPSGNCDPCTPFYHLTCFSHNVQVLPLEQSRWIILVPTMLLSSLPFSDWLVPTIFFVLSLNRIVLIPIEFRLIFHIPLSPTSSCSSSTTHTLPFNFARVTPWFPVTRRTKPQNSL